MSDIYQESLAYHRQQPAGKLQIMPTKPMESQHDLALAYSPGVAQPVREIAENADAAYEYTAKGNLLAIVSNGTAILGLGNRGALASKPVMEGKAVLFKKFADIDVFDIEVDTQDPEKMIECIELMAPTFGGINLEDIKAPECFLIERELKKRLSIPVFHDDQHGTAVVAGAGLLNAFRVAGKSFAEASIVINGAGAAGIAIAEMLISLGSPRNQITLCDSKGVIYEGRQEGVNEFKSAFAHKTNARSLADALRGADVFIGVSQANILTPEMLLGMNEKPIVFAMANPEPEIGYELAQKTRSDVIMATGRSDFPNQVNNLLCFPFLFRGALDTRASSINDAMKVAAVHAIADLAREDVPQEVLDAYKLPELSFGSDYIIPKPLDPRLLTTVSPAVAKASMESGAARVQVDLSTYPQLLRQRMNG
ncbi:MAG TPA: malic enzyme-like NAD(P)-binding protein [Candidatus Peribacteraceae bacterium]|nr:malic enzyme-like NAD(P)-binding protein [Candidatus Peribacteraceae bacterium]